MEYRACGDTGLEVSVLALGCSSFWAKSSHPEAQAVQLVRDAIDLGITLFDTGPSYADGQAERRLGAALRGADRTRLVIGSKAGTFLGRSGLYKDFSPEAVRRSVEGSLDRLGCGHLDILCLHGPTTPDLDDPLIECLESLKEEGRVRVVGINTGDHAVIRGALAYGVFEAFMTDCNILVPGWKELAREIADKGRFTLAGTPMAQALFKLSTVMPTSRKNVWYLLRALKNHPADLLAARKFGFLNRLDGLSGPQAALAYVLANPDVSTALFGTTSPEHLRENVAVAEARLPEDVARRVDALTAG